MLAKHHCPDPDDSLLILVLMMCCSCQIAMADGTVQAGAIKNLNYWHPDARFDSEAELAGLQAALGLPHLVQCLAAFKYKGADRRHYMAVVTQ